MKFHLFATFRMHAYAFARRDYWLYSIDAGWGVSRRNTDPNISRYEILTVLFARFLKMML